jgi:hypothetical protein
MLTLTPEVLQELDKFIQEMPVKYGLPLLNFINEKIQQQAQEKVKEEITEEIKS